MGTRKRYINPRDGFGGEDIDPGSSFRYTFCMKVFIQENKGIIIVAIFVMVATIIVTGTKGFFLNKSLGADILHADILGEHTGTLLIKKHVVGGPLSASDFTIRVRDSDIPSGDGIHATPVVGAGLWISPFQGSEEGSSVVFDAGSYYVVEEVFDPKFNEGYEVSYEGDCSGTIQEGDAKTCTVVNTFIVPPTGTLTVIKKVVGGNKKPEDFTLNINKIISQDEEDIKGGDSLNETQQTIDSFPGSTDGHTTQVAVDTIFTVTEEPVDGYETTYEGDCEGVIVADANYICTVTNKKQAGSSVVGTYREYSEEVVTEEDVSDESTSDGGGSGGGDDKIVETFVPTVPQLPKTGIGAGFLLTKKQNVSEEVIARLSIRKINIEAPIVSIGRNAKGAVDVPHEIQALGWFRESAFPGSSGTTIIDGHRGWNAGIRLPFDKLNQISIGDIVTIDLNDGSVVKYRVIKKQLYPYDAYSPEVFFKGGGTFMNLITCDGDWDPVQKTSSKRLVVFTEKI